MTFIKTMETITVRSEGVVGDTKKYIIGTARRLFSKYSYLGVSMSDIAKKLNFTKAALYYHFTGKAEIYGNVLDEVFSDLNSLILQALNEKTADKKLRRVITSYLVFGLKEKNLVKALVLKLSPKEHNTTEHIARLRERVAGLIEPVVKEALLNKKLTEKTDDKLLTSLLTCMMDGLLLECSFLDKKIDPEKVSDQITKILFQN